MKIKKILIYIILIVFLLIILVLGFFLFKKVVSFDLLEQKNNLNINLNKKINNPNQKDIQELIDQVQKGNIQLK